MSIFTSNAAAVNQGQSIITCTDNSDFSGVPSGSVVIINNDHLAVVDSGTAASSNNSTLTLRSPWPSDLPDITAGKLFVLAGVDAIKETVESSRLVTTALITTKQALQAIIDAQGTAATADLTESATDSTLDRVYKVGDNVGIEYGTNANGSYTKFPDGTLECRARVDLTTVSTNGQDLRTVWTYPLPFLVSPQITSSIFDSVELESNILNGDVSYLRNALNNTIGSTIVLYPREGVTFSSGSVLVDVVARGRWK